MSINASSIVGLDLEDLTPKQIRKMLRAAAHHMLPRHKRSKRDEDEDEEDEGMEADDKEREDLADLSEERSGGSKAPPVEEDDLPLGHKLKKKDDKFKKKKKDPE